MPRHAQRTNAAAPAPPPAPAPLLNLSRTTLYPEIGWLTRIPGHFVPAHQRGTEMPRECIYFSSLAPAPPLPLNPNSCGWSQWLPGEAFNRKDWTCHGVEYVLEGSGELTVNRRRYDLQPGDVFILHPAEHHAYRSGPSGVFRKAFMAFHGGLTREVFHTFGLDAVSHVRPSVRAAPHVKHLFAEIQAMAQYKPDGYIWRISALGYELLNVLAQAARAPHAEPVLPAALVQAVQYADAHLFEPLGVSDMARAAHCSTRHLSRLFQEHLRIGVHDWLTRNKILAAASMLRTSAARVHLIAEHIGFDNPFHFMSVFKSVVGMTPTEYRRLSSGMVPRRNCRRRCRCRWSRHSTPG
jgi:AraC-like DNA-binding protein